MDNGTIMRHTPFYIITAGSTYLDIDAYACMVAMAELLGLEGKAAVAYSTAPPNYSVCPSLLFPHQVADELPQDFDATTAKYIIVDVSDPAYLSSSVPLEQVIEVYDHHTGFEAYWQEKIGDGARISFIGAAATLIYEEWQKADLLGKMSPDTAKLLVAAILDNTLNLTSTNATKADRDAFLALSRIANVGEDFSASYFSEVQGKVEEDLQNALFSDLKTLKGQSELPPYIAQIAVWDPQSILEKLSVIRKWFAHFDGWMLNVIDICRKCSYFICDSSLYQKKIEAIFHVHFHAGVAKTPIPYLRKEIIKKTKRKSKAGQ